MPEIDGLRAVACLLVVLNHCEGFGKIATGPELGLGTWGTLSLVYLMRYGFCGVYLFFILSGFCLAYPLFLAPQKPFSWNRYGFTRFRRIYPPYLASLILFWVLVLGASCLPMSVLSPFRFPLPTPKAFIYAVLLIYIWGNPVYWTLVLEARWYFLFPLLALPFQRIAAEPDTMKMKRRFIRAAALMMAATLVVSAIYNSLTLQTGLLPKILSALTSLPFFLPLFAMGILVAFLFARFPTMSTGTYRRLIAFAAVALLVGVLLFCYWTATLPNKPRDGWECMLPSALIFTSLLVLSLYHPGTKRPLSHPLLAFLGKISYSIYLIHLPVIIACEVYARPLNLSGLPRFFFFGTLVPFICIGISWLFFWCFERPIIENRLFKSPSQRAVQQPEQPLS